MSLIVVPCTSADYPHIAEVEQKAFAPNRFTPVLFPGPLPEGVLEFRAQGLAREAAEDVKIQWIKVIDTNYPDGQPLAYAKWVLYTDEPLISTARNDFGEGCNVEACQLVFGGLAEQRNRLMGGKRCIYLHILVTDPKQTRRGAAGKLLSWGAEQSRKHSLPLYLESTETAHELYKRHNFADLEAHTVDLSRWGASEPHQTWAMIREVD